MPLISVRPEPAGVVIRDQRRAGHVLAVVVVVGLRLQLEAKNGGGNGPPKSSSRCMRLVTNTAVLPMGPSLRTPAGTGAHIPCC